MTKQKVQTASKTVKRGATRAKKPSGKVVVRGQKQSFLQTVLSGKTGLIVVALFAAIVGGVGTHLVSTSSAQTATTCTKQIKYKSKGDCVKYAQGLLVQYGYLSNTTGKAIDGNFGIATANAVINFQRAMGLRGPKDDGIIGSTTWGLLKSPKQVPTTLDSRCLTSGTVFCASMSQRKLFFVKNGTVVKTVDARFGGMAWDGRLNRGQGGFRVHRTGMGSFNIYARVDSPASKTYGENSMPLSLMFDKNMYIHYSSDFASKGYNGASHGCINIRDKVALQSMYDDPTVVSAVKKFPNNATHNQIFQPVNKSAIKVVVY